MRLKCIVSETYYSLEHMSISFTNYNLSVSAQCKGALPHLLNVVIKCCRSVAKAPKNMRSQALKSSTRPGINDSFSKLAINWSFLALQMLPHTQITVPYTQGSQPSVNLSLA